MEVDDLFNDSDIRRAAYIDNFKKVSFVNDTNNPSNGNFVKHGDPTSIPGADRSYIPGSKFVSENSQDDLFCTQFENSPEDLVEFWDIPRARDNNPDHIERAVIVSLSSIINQSINQSINTNFLTN